MWKCCVNLSRVIFSHVGLLLSIALLMTSALAYSPIPEIKVGPFTSLLTLESAKALQGSKLECFRERQAEHSVEAACGVMIEDDKNHGHISIGTNGSVLQIVRFVPMPTGMDLDEVYRQARLQYQYLGQPVYELPQPLPKPGEFQAYSASKDLPAGVSPEGLVWSDVEQS